jgi:organic hydroperoxide reductase OsmC/OhrA
MHKVYGYSAHAHWTMHKRGILEAADIPRTINFAAPPEFGGDPGLWTPEHLLLGAIATCYVSTFRAIADLSKLEFGGMDVFVDGTMEKQEGGFRFTKVVLRPVISIASEEDRIRVQHALEKAERGCPVSRSLSCPVELLATIDLEEPVAAE